MTATFALRTHVRFQYLAGRLAIWILCPLIYLAIRVARYRIRDLDRMREKVKRLYRQHPGPWLICANHLTLIDSVILAYAMAPWYRYLVHYHRLPWNMPEKKNFNRNTLLTMLTFITKCVPVVRGGDRDSVARSMAKCEFLLAKNESLMIFPEGTRSRTGRIDPDSFSYGVGRLYLQIPDCRVMCIYLRGDRQSGFSRFPAPKQDFVMDVRSFSPRPSGKGLRAQRDCARQIVEALVHMENRLYREHG